MIAAINSLLPSNVGSLESYIQSVNRFPVLTPEEEFDLATKFQENDDLQAARQLVVSHLRVVVSVARGYSGYGLAQADLIQEGNIGLMKAVKRYDPNRGVRLVSFALHWIRAEIHEFVVKNWRLVKIATTKSQRKLFFNLRSLKQGLAPLNQAQIKEIAQQLNVSEADVAEMEGRFSNHEIALESTSTDDEEVYSPIHFLADNEEHEPAYILEAEENERLQTSGLALALSTLDQRSRQIIETRWLRENSVATLHDLAKEFNVSAERIRQIEQKALTKMHASLSSAAR
jgi:RNA polymerase sigma-32 factor